MHWTSDLLEIIDGFEHSEDLEIFALYWGIEDDPYFKQRLLELKWKELEIELELDRDNDGCLEVKQPNIQYGGGPSAASQNVINFSLHKVGEKQFKHSLAIDRHYRVNVHDNPVENAKLKDIHDELHGLFDRALDEVKADREKSDLARVVVRHQDLQNPIIVPLQPLEELDANKIMETIENVLTSNEELTMSSGFEIDIGTIELPKGGSRRRIISLQGDTNSLVRKSSIGYIDNTDELCLARSICYAWSKLNMVSQEEWLLLTENSTMSLLENILLHKKVPVSYYIHLQAKKRHEQKKLAEALCRLTGVPTDRRGTIQDIQQFEKLLNVGIHVVSSKLGNKFIRIPSEENANKQKLFLYLIENEQEQHFHAILSINGFFSTAYFCQSCLVPYNDKSKHHCLTVCQTCKEECEITDTQMSCRTCHMTCRSKECFLRHGQKKQLKKGSVTVVKPSQCQTYWKCITCKHVLKLGKGVTPDTHRCGEYLCPMCQQQVMPGHLCYQRAKEPKHSFPKFLFFDMETTQDTCIECDCKDPNNHVGGCLHGHQEHKVNLVVTQSACTQCLQESVDQYSCCDKCGSRCDKCKAWDEDKNAFAKRPCAKTCGNRQKVFYGDTAAEDFCAWLFTEQHAKFTVISHNGRGFDHFPILKYVIDQSIRPKTIFNGSKLLYMEVAKSLDIRFVDSLNFLPMKLAALPKCFGLTELKKGYFPHFFNVKENQNYKGRYPDTHYYGADSMSETDRKSFLSWHTEKVQKQTLFDFHTELVDYCISDVDILRQACLKFWTLVRETTGEWEMVKNKKGVLKRKLARSVDPFQQVTIAGVCSDIFRKKFLEEEWRVTIKDKQNHVSDWIPAKKVNDQMTVYYNTWLTMEDLQKRELCLENTEFVRSPIAFIPSEGYVKRDQYSKKSIQWLEWKMEINRRKGTPLHIQHALNIGETTVPGTKYKLDGYCQSTNTAYEFHGCRYHGCTKCFKTNREETILPTTNQSIAELYALTVKKEKYLKQIGYKYVSIWECQFDDNLKSSTDMYNFVQSLDLQERLNPRDSFFGGRTESICLYKEVDGEKEKINYVDFTSLYPYCNKYTRYPLYHPEIITNDFDSIDKYFGIAKIKILPPRGIFIPVLPVRSNGKLKFPLCRTCAESEQTDQPCTCCDEQRAIIGTYCTPEINKAVEQGYRVLKIYEVYHFPESSQYNPDTQNGGIFTNYINTFLRIKQEASGYPDWVKTSKDKKQYIDHYFKHEGILLRESHIKKNPGLRSLAKLCLNSFWGKFGQRTNLCQTKYIHDSEADEFFKLLTDTTKKVKNFQIITDDIMHLEWEHNTGFVPDDSKTNIFLASFTTTYARLHLYDILERLGDRVLYMDTDSCIYVSKTGCYEPELGDYLGQLTNELESCECITQFATAGAKNYAYVTNKGRRICKVRGFTLNYANSQLINFQVVKDLVTTNNNHSVMIRNDSKICRDKRKRKLYNRSEHKTYRMVFTKRVIQGDLTTLPYGY